MTNLLIRKLEQRGVLQDEERRVLQTILSGAKKFAVEEDIVRQGSRPHESTLMLSGFCGRYATLADGSRQITALHIPGDFIDLHSFLLHVMDHGVVALTPCTVTTVPHEILRDVTERFPNLTRMLWLSTLIDSAMHRQWLVAMGRLPAVAHAAHLFCELAVRLKVVGLGDEKAYPLPFTQQQLADVLGLSAIHVNRVLKDLRERKFISWRAKKLTILDWHGLARLAEFDPTYLHLEWEPR